MALEVGIVIPKSCRSSEEIVHCTVRYKDSFQDDLIQVKLFRDADSFGAAFSVDRSR